MRWNTRTFIELAAEEFNLAGPIYEFGAFQVAGQSGLADLRSLFPGREYIGCDMRSGPGVDEVVDVTCLPLADDTAGTIICVDTLEHVFDVMSAVREMRRVLRPGGCLLVTAPMDFRVHAYPDDYWRLTPSCLARLLAPLDAMMVGSQGVECHPHTVLGVGWKGPLSAALTSQANRFMSRYQERLQDAAAAVPWRRKLKNWLRYAFMTKGDRRRIQHHHAVRFTMDIPLREMTVAASDTFPTMLGTSGSRLNLELE